MKISLKGWLLFIIIAVICFGVWYKIEYPRYAFIDLSVDRGQALAKAEAFLDSLGVDSLGYLKTAIFNADNSADRYLQKTLGPDKEEEFIKLHGYELFAWRIRFFKELQKEEYIITISSRSGNVLGFRHFIEDIEPRGTIEKDSARQKAEGFLKQFYGINLEDYDFHEEQIKRYENRIDYGFLWEKKGVYIPWKKGEGGAKLVLGAIISGDEIREFYKSTLDIPEKFKRYIENQLALGEYLYSLYFLLFILFVVWSIFLVVKRKHTFVINISKRFYVYLALFLFIANLFYIFNNIQNIVFVYPTSIRLTSFLGHYLIRLLINTLFLTTVFIMPGLAGESLRNEVLPDKKYSAFLQYIRSTFFCRSLAKSAVLGYLLFFITLGLQAVIFYLGQKYLGVWREWYKLTQFSSAYLPFLSAFVIAANASLSEEVTFRLFGIGLFKKYLRNTCLAVILSSLIWGFGHSEYAIFPAWFRGIEVSIIGLLFGFIFVRYGLIPLIVAHYLLDAFLGVAAHILGRSAPYSFFTSLLILAIPLIIAAIAYLLNREEKEKNILTMLSSTQEYNLNILITFVSEKKSQGLSAEAVKNELMLHNWDVTLIDLAVKKVF